MIPFNFSYHCPASAQEALECFHEADAHGMSPVFYSGGTEIISRARNNEIQFDTVIDIKSIRECLTHRVEQDVLLTGAAVTLSEITDKGTFPMLQKVARQVATRNARNKITVGGNILSSLPYKEVILPFLLSNSKAVIADKSGKREESVVKLFGKGSGLQRGELLLQLKTDVQYLSRDHYVEKRTKQSAVNYPVNTLCSMKKDGLISMGFSGSSLFPFRSDELDSILNENDLSDPEKINHIIDWLSEQIIDDFQASAPYRKFIIRKSLANMLKYFEEVS